MKNIVGYIVMNEVRRLQLIEMRGLRVYQVEEGNF